MSHRVLKILLHHSFHLLVAVAHMASETRDVDSGAKQSTSVTENDERLDFFSDKFDPLLALTTPGVAPPVKGAITHDNISKYWSTYNVLHAVKPKPVTEKENTVQRRFTESQMPIKSAAKETKRKTILNIDDRVNEGPLELIKKCKTERLPVKIYTRHAHGVRGYCECFIALYDKYMNLTIEDVTETWTRTKKTKIPATNSLVPKHNKSLEKYFTPIEIIKTDRKTETCRRFVKRMLIRGEQIVLISTLSNI